MRTESFSYRKEKEKNIEKAALGAVLVLSGCMAPPTIPTPEHPEKKGETLSSVTLADMPEIEKEPLVNVKEIRQSAMKKLEDAGVPEKEAQDIVDETILAFFRKGEDGSVRIVLNKALLGKNFKVNFPRPPQSFLDSLSSTNEEFDASAVQFVESLKSQTGISVLKDENPFSFRVLPNTSGFGGKESGGSSAVSFSRGTVASHPIFDVRAISIGIDFDYLYKKFIEKAPFRNPTDKKKYWNDLVDMVRLHEFLHIAGVDHVNKRVHTREDHPKHPSLSILNEDIRISYSYRLSPKESYVTDKLVTDRMDPAIDPAIQVVKMVYEEAGKL